MEEMSTRKKLETLHEKSANWIYNLFTGKKGEFKLLNEPQLLVNTFAGYHEADSEDIHSNKKIPGEKKIVSVFRTWFNRFKGNEKFTELLKGPLLKEYGLDGNTRDYLNRDINLQNFFVSRFDPEFFLKHGDDKVHGRFYLELQYPEIQSFFEIDKIKPEHIPGGISQKDLDACKKSIITTLAFLIDLTTRDNPFSADFAGGSYIPNYLLKGPRKRSALLGAIAEALHEGLDRSFGPVTRNPWRPDDKRLFDDRLSEIVDITAQLFLKPELSKGRKKIPKMRDSHFLAGDIFRTHLSKIDPEHAFMIALMLMKRKDEFMVAGRDSYKRNLKELKNQTKKVKKVAKDLSLLEPADLKRSFAKTFEIEESDIRQKLNEFKKLGEEIEA